jgi:GTP-binding protein HflX
MEAVDEVLESLGCHDVPQIALLNKIDIVDDASMTELLARHRTQSLSISALAGEGIEELSHEVIERMKGETATVTVSIPQREGKLIAEIDRRADVRERRYLNAVVEMDICMNRTQLRQLTGRNPSMTVVQGEIDPPDTHDPDECV